MFDEEGTEIEKKNKSEKGGIFGWFGSEKEEKKTEPDDREMLIHVDAEREYLLVLFGNVIIPARSVKHFNKIKYQ